MPTLSEIAKLAGVSPAVVSRVVNGDKTLRISKETLERVRNVVAETGYTPNRAARSLRSTETGLIAMVVHGVTNPVYAEIARGAHAAASAAGKAILINDASGGAESAKRLIELVGGKGVDGLILQPDESDSDQVLARAAQENVPTVLLQAHLDASLPAVVLPDETAARMAVDHLIERGHTRIGCVATGPGLSFTNDRITGWRTSLEKCGLKGSAELLRHASPTIEGGEKAMATLLDENPDLTAVFCCNVLAGVGVMAEAFRRGKKIPEDVALVSIHDIPLAAYFRVPMTTVQMPLFELGKTAVESLLIKAPFSRPEVVQSDPVLIVRSST